MKVCFQRNDEMTIWGLRTVESVCDLTDGVYWSWLEYNRESAGTA